jgi:forespore regulator of the sigma-K checkpoint
MRFNRTAFMQATLAAIAVTLFMLIGRVPGIMIVGSATAMDTQKSEPLAMKIVLERIYLDGEVSEEVVQENIYSLENFWAKYDQWRLIDIDDSEVVFSRQIDDISPLLKSNGYFGISDKGVFSIFNGKPGQSRIIQSFFQIDVKKLESWKQKELLDGIPIKNKDRYVKVLETFKSYSTDGS